MSSTLSTRTERRSGLRRGWAVLTATALATAVLPMAVASAAPSAAANLTSGTSVLPGANSFAIAVRNSGSPLIGETINSVLVTLPSAAGVKSTAAEFTPAAGWTSKASSSGPLQTYQFNGGSIAPGATTTFTFPSDVAAPFDRDLQGTFKVSTSSDGGRTASAATGALGTTVRVLEVLDSGLREVTAGFADGKGTAGQTIQYGVQVKNHARSALTVTPVLSSNSADDKPANPAGASVPAGTVADFSIPVTLGRTNDRTATFTVNAAATNAAAQAKSAAFAVQAPAVLDLNRAAFAPTSVRPDAVRTFTVKATKRNQPTLTGLTGTLVLPGAETTLADPTAVGDNGEKALTFKPVAVQGADGLYDAVFDFAGTDSNGFPFSQKTTLEDVLTIDALAPVVEVLATLPVSDGRQQTEAKDNDTISVRGSVDEAGAALDFVELRTDNGQKIPVPVTRNGNTFTGSVRPDFADGAGAFTVVAQATDAAGNAGADTTEAFVVDNVLPAFSLARTEAADQILVRFDEVGQVFGGCNASQWKVDGELLVREVRFSDGSACVAGESGPDNDRILVLLREKDQDFQTNVEYVPGRRPLADPVKDGAASNAVTAVQFTEIGIAPAPPVITEVLRNTGTGNAADREVATFDEGRYFTRFGGEDLLLTFTGARAASETSPGYEIVVLDEADQELKRVVVAGSPASVSIPLPTTPGTYTRKLQFVRAGLLSELVPFQVEIDQAAPLLQAAEKVDQNTVGVTFTEKLAGGTDFAFDWFGYELNPERDDDPSNDRFYYPAGSVSGTGDSRTIELQESFAGLGEFGGADYYLQSTEGERYVDRAGNELADTTSL